ncbi:hypothetical protein K438DRAFT_1646271 [Mycena galopus ATCC 62051]|nr:hypothetical protein K438DRAFT_1646271 [Mycena galopus ATCC 62051]
MTVTLAYKRVVFSQKMADDKGSGAKTDIATWSPSLEPGWFYVGQASGNAYDMAPTGVVVHELYPGAGVLADVVRWEKVWDDAGSGKKRDYSLWRGVAPSEDYVVLGGIFSNNAGYAPPTAEQTSGIKAVRRDCVVPDMTNKVWDDAGSRAKQDGSVWTTTGAQGIATNVSVPVASHSTPGAAEAFSLNTLTVIEIPA